MGKEGGFWALNMGFFEVSYYGRRRRGMSVICVLGFGIWGFLRFHTREEEEDDDDDDICDLYFRLWDVGTSS